MNEEAPLEDVASLLKAIAAIEWVNVHQAAMRREGRFRCVGHSAQPRGEIAHEGRDLRRGRKGVPPGFGADVAAQISVASRNVRAQALDDQRMQVADAAFRERHGLAAKLANVAHGVVVVEGFQTVLQGLAR